MKSNKNKNESPSNSISLKNVGITVRNLTSQEKKNYNVKNGIFITVVQPFSNAAAQGLFSKLVITEIDRKPVKNVEQFKKIIESKKGSAVLLMVKDSKGNSRFIGLNIPQ